MLKFSQHSLFALLSHKPVVRELHISKEIDTLPIFHELDFVRVQAESQSFAQELINWCDQFFQFSPVIRNNHKIVCISYVVLHTQLLFYKLIEVIHVHVRKQLRSQVANRNASRMEEVSTTGFKAADDFSHQPHNLRIFDAPRQYLQQYLVVDAVKEFPHIALERITLAPRLYAFLFRCGTKKSRL